MSDNFIETNNPEINVDKLMEKIREEVAQKRQQAYETTPQNKSEIIKSTGREKSIIDTLMIRSIISSAEAQAAVGVEVPQILRFRGLIRKIAIFVGKKVIYLSSFITEKQRSFNRLAIHALKTITDNIERLSNEIAVRNEPSQQIETLREQIKSVREEQAETRTTLEEAIKERGEKIRTLEKTISYLKSSVVMQERQTSIFLEEARKRLPKPFSSKQIKNIVKEKDHFFDALYVSLEDEFRGTREKIKERTKVYLPYIKEANAGIKDSPVLDIGCGRGEWLELLKEEGLQARGVDINSVSVTQCKERRLEVIEDNIIVYLRNLPDASIGAITGFHIIEHLPLDALINLLDETVRVLKPGGIAIFETPNPQNVIVGSCNFYTDPTHIKPIPSWTIEFLVEARGLCRVEILKLHPFPESFKLADPGLPERFNELFYGPQDYAVIGYRS